MPIEWYYLHIWGCLNFSWQSWVQLVSFPAQHFSWCTLHMLNKQGENIHTFPNFESVHHSMSSSNCCFLTCTQVSQETGKVVWYSYLLKNFPRFVVIHTVKGISLVNEVEVDVFLDFLCFLHDPMDVGNLFLVPLPFLKPACISGSSWFASYWSLTWRILSITLLACEISAIMQ